MSVNKSLNIELRSATTADAQRLQQSVWPERSVTAVLELLQRVEDNARRGRGQGLIASSIAPNARPVAFGQLTLWPRTSEISDLAVAAEVRGQGIGTAMIIALIEVARSLNLPEVEIGAAQSNPRALALYRRLGFQDNRTIDIDLGSGLEPVLYLSLILRSIG